MTDAIQHGQAAGIHRGAFVGATAPDTSGVQDHVLWVDSSGAPPFQLKMWDFGSSSWLLVGIVGSAVGVDSSGAVAVDCLTYPNGAALCNPSADVVMLVTPTGTFQWDATGYTLPGGHRLERVLA